MKRLVFTVVFLSVGTMPIRALCDTWCSTHFPDAVFCEDFDRYCVNPPPIPQSCDPQGSDIRDNGPMQDRWNVIHNCGWVPGVHDENCGSLPYCAKIGCQPWNNQMGYGNTGLANDIRRKFGESHSEILATDLTPLTLEFAMNGGTKMRLANLYLELGRGRGGALTAGENSLTNWIISDDCRLCGSTDEQGFFPIICRQSPAPSGCADISAAPVLPVIAAGALAFLDRNPCHCGEAGLHSPSASHLVFFDGRQWHTLRRGLFPDPGGSEPAPGDFSLVAAAVQHRVRLILMSTTVTVELRVGSPAVLSRCEIPRAYVGPFGSLLMGYQMPCQLVEGTWDCNDAVDCNGPCGPVKVCCVSGAPGGGTVAVDDIALYGGQGYAEPGACCFADTSCVDGAFQGDCQIFGGQPAAPGSTCVATPCCPPLAVDHDMDGDVDLEDFGWFQTCLSGTFVAPPNVPCHCADLDHDGDVDAPDIDMVRECISGPDEPVDPNCLN